MANKLVNLYTSMGITPGKKGAKRYRSIILKLKKSPTLFFTLVCDPIHPYAKDVGGFIGLKEEINGEIEIL